MSAPMGAEESERLGHKLRHFKMSVSAPALALAWARQENGPHGATVLVDREVSPMGRHGQLWRAPAESTFACSVVLRPRMSPDEADLMWLVVTQAAAECGEAVGGRPLSTGWPDTVKDKESGELVATTKAEVQLGPGQIRSAVVTARMDMEKIGLGPEQRDDLLDAFLRSIDEITGRLAEEADSAVASYKERLDLVGKRVKIRLLPKGETRGVVRGVDRSARLELESGGGMLEHITVDMLRDLEVV